MPRTPSNADIAVSTAAWVKAIMACVLMGKVFSSSTLSALRVCMEGAFVGLFDGGFVPQNFATELGLSDEHLLLLLNLVDC